MSAGFKIWAGPSLGESACERTPAVNSTAPCRDLADQSRSALRKLADFCRPADAGTLRQRARIERLKPRHDIGTNTGTPSGSYNEAVSIRRRRKYGLAQSLALQPWGCICRTAIIAQDKGRRGIIAGKTGRSRSRETFRRLWRVRNS